MDNTNKQLVNNILLANYHKVYVIDIGNDKVFIYNFINNNWEIDKESSFTDYLNNLQKTLSGEDFNNLSSYLSIGKLEEELSNGQTNIKYTINNNNIHYLLNISLLKNNNQ